MFEGILDNPLYQSALIPFIIALVIGLLLRPLGGVAAGLGFAAAFYTAVYLIIGFQFFPLTSTRKMLLAGLGAVAVGLVLAFLPWRRWRWLGPLMTASVAIAAAGVALWMLWPLVLRREGAELWMLVLPSLAYAAWLVGGVDSLRDRPVATVVACLALGIGTGISAVLGSSALLGQLGGAIAAATGAYALVFLIRGEFPPGASFALPAALLAALIGLASVAYARLPWYSLLPLVLIPLLARLPAPERRGVLVKGLVITAWVMPAAAAAIFITVRESGMPSF